MKTLNTIAKTTLAALTGTGLVSAILLIAHCIAGGFFFSGQAYNAISNNLCGGVLVGLIAGAFYLVSTAKFPQQS